MSPKPSISMSDDLYDEIEDRLGPGFSQFMREAARRSMRVEDISEQFDGKLPDEWWEDALEEYVERRTRPVSDRERDQEIEA